jgi:hypothetical protein
VGLVSDSGRHAPGQATAHFRWQLLSECVISFTEMMKGRGKCEEGEKCVTAVS